MEHVQELEDSAGTETEKAAQEVSRDIVGTTNITGTADITGIGVLDFSVIHAIRKC